ncbi:MAG: putative hydrolase [Firmicutes bacterium]|nr:putative hydrolase [Bacillota bacterium]
MQNIEIISNRGEKLAAIIFHPTGEPRSVVIVCHGFRGGKENGGRIHQFADRLNQVGIAVLAFDFSGSGQSEGDFVSLTLSRQAADLESVVDYVCTQFAVPIILLGRSFGGSTVIVEGAGDKRIDGFVLWSTPIFMAETFSAMMPDEYNRMQNGQVVAVCDDFGCFDLGPELAADFVSHDMEGYLQAIGNRPVLIIQAEDDELVSPKNAIYMQERMENVSLCLVEKAGHRFLDKTSLREDMTIEWLNSFLKVEE